MLSRLFQRGLPKLGGGPSMMGLVQARVNSSSSSVQAAPFTTATSEQDKPKRTRRKKQRRVMKDGPHNTGLHQLCSLSPELSKIVGASKASRVDINKKLWGYIKSHNLQEESDKRNIKPDAVLGKHTYSSSILDGPIESMSSSDNKATVDGKEEPKSQDSEQFETPASSTPAEPVDDVAHEQAEIKDLLDKMHIAPAAPPKAHKFWNTQPVPQLDADPVPEDARGPIDEPKKVSDIPKDPYNLPAAFEWSNIDVNDPEQIQEVYTLLNENYVEDDEAMFRFDYSPGFLRWALTPPHYVPDWHFGVRVKSNGKLVGFITGIPATMGIRGDELRTVEINFLCVHKKLRSKRLAPVLIKEVTRRVNLTDRWQAVYTSGAILPRPITTARYHHRSLNPKKLCEVGFTRLAPRMTMARCIKLYKVADHPTTSGLRPMEMKDRKQVTKLLNEYLSKFKAHPILSQQEVGHWLLPRGNVIQTYVREENGKITDFLSFYSLPSSVLGNDKHKTLYAAYSYYNVANTVSLKQLMSDALVLAKQEGYDVFNALNLMDNNEFLEDLKFGRGDGDLQYYLYNW
ncbi:glycylpeptide N-tetradecanoyltransferase, partial [Perkinsus olseni]